MNITKETAFELMEERCELCNKWFRINQFKGHCSNDMNWYDTTYQEDWCENFEEATTNIIDINNK